jgi:hypothetical protein
MVRCEECLRANPPTRLNCLYCGESLPVTETSAGLLKPTLKPVDNLTLAYNNICLSPAMGIPVEGITEAASFLKLDVDHLRGLLNGPTPMPVARTEALDEAELIDRRLTALGFVMRIVSDSDLQIQESPPIRLRSVDMDENGLTPKLMAEGNEYQVPWGQIILIVTGRLSRKRVELQERKGSKGETQIDDASQFFSDEAVVDIYSEDYDSKFRILANGFDFSGLRGKKLMVAENFSLLLDLLRRNSPQADYDAAYNSCRQALEIVWPCGQQTESGGWRRQRFGKYTVGAVSESSNEDQFTRYSRLRFFLKTQAR